jgi:hypothetical protein
MAVPMLAGFLWNTWEIAALMGARIALAVVTEVYAFTIERNSRLESVGADSKSAELPMCAARVTNKENTILPRSHDDAVVPRPPSSLYPRPGTVTMNPGRFGSTSNFCRKLAT